MNKNWITIKKNLTDNGIKFKVIRETESGMVLNFFDYDHCFYDNIDFITHGIWIGILYDEQKGIPIKELNNYIFT